MSPGLFLVYCLRIDIVGFDIHKAPPFTAPVHPVIKADVAPLTAGRVPESATAIRVQRMRANTFQVSRGACQNRFVLNRIYLHIFYGENSVREFYSIEPMPGSF